MCRAVRVQVCNGKFTPVRHLNIFSLIMLALNVGDLL